MAFTKNKDNIDTQIKLVSGSSTFKYGISSISHEIGHRIIISCNESK